RGRWVVLAVVLVAVTLVASVFVFGLGRDPTVVRSALIGREAPSFDLPLLSGPGTVRLSDLRGKVVVLNFWASWCTDCRIEHSALAAAWDRYRDQGVVLVGVAFEDTASSSRAFAQSLGMDWPIVRDAASRHARGSGRRDREHPPVPGVPGPLRSRLAVGARHPDAREHRAAAAGRTNPGRDPRGVRGGLRPMDPAVAAEAGPHPGRLAHPIR